MNRLFTSIIFVFGLIVTATAQNSGTTGLSQDPNEIVVLSSYVDGNYNVERLLVMESSPSNNEFVMRYKINLTKLISSYDNNSEEIAGLHNFVESIQDDSLKRITNYDIVGFASPDGPAALNKRIANERAADFSKFVDQECDMDEYPRSVTGTPYMWSDARAAIATSDVPNRAEVLSIIDSGAAQSSIQTQLEALPSAWSYIKSNILPPMRSVEIHIKYNSWKVVESRTLIEPVEPQTVVVDMAGGRGGRGSGKRGDASCIEDDYLYCVLVEMPGQSIDFDSDSDTGKSREKFKLGKRGLKYKERGENYEEKEKIRARRAYMRWWSR